MLGDFRSHLVARARDVWADHDAQFNRVKVRERRGDDSRDESPPTRVHDGELGSVRVHDEQGYAVGNEGRQRHVVALSYLRGHGPTPQQTLAERLCMDASSTVCLLNELEDHGLIVRQRDRSDRRRGIIELSPPGELALRRVDRALETVESEILASLDTEERTQLHGLLARLNVGEADYGAAANET